MQREQQSPKRVAKSFVAGLLAVLLLAFGVLAASGSLHHSLHHDSADASSCVICLLAQGQIDIPETSPVVATTVFHPLCGLLAASAGVPWSFDFLLPPGRAPPCLSHSF